MVHFATAGPCGAGHDRRRLLTSGPGTRSDTGRGGAQAHRADCRCRFAGRVTSCGRLARGVARRVTRRGGQAGGLAGFIAGGVPGAIAQRRGRGSAGARRGKLEGHLPGQRRLADQLVA
jgi:hypothetical protein